MPSRSDSVSYGSPALVAGAAVLLCAAPAWAAGPADEFYFGDLGQALATLAIFVILLLVLRRYAWRPIVSGLQRRERGVADLLESAQRSQAQAEGLQSLYQQRLDGAEAEAERILAKSRQEAHALGAQALAEARDEAQEYADRAREEIEEAREAALRDLRETTAHLATDLAGRLVRKTLSPEEHRRLLAESLEEIRERAAGKS